VTGGGSGLIQVDPRRPQTVARAVASAAEAVAAGGLVILPTETVYGIACRPDHPGAIARLFEAKRRPRDLRLPVLVVGAAAAWEVARPNPLAEALARLYWPGPLTMVLPRTARSRPWELGAADVASDSPRSIAVRVPNHAVALAILARTGPLATTSANLTATPPLDDPVNLIRTFGDAVSLCVVMAPGTSGLAGRPSTVLDLTGEAVRVLRAGALDPAEVQAKLGRALPPTQWVDFD
jgi:L-threonylcarbamoyladenylate synthase